MDAQHRAKSCAPWLLTVAIAGRLAGDLLGVRRFRVHLPRAGRRSSGRSSSTRGRSRGTRGRRFWTTMAGFALGVVVGLLLGVHRRQLALRLQRALSAAGRVQQHPEGGVRADPGRVVRHRRGAGDPDRVPDLLLSRSSSTSRPASRRSSPSSRTCCARSARRAGTSCSRSGCRARCRTSSPRSRSRSRWRSSARSSRRPSRRTTASAT